ncbi:TetR/AcrR family transcriptional regulator [Mycobacterium kansasii]|uniref:Bacterial regulatory s, tetR family protein n=3 Tax=Mycobacterium kansasii TaxID=1768 RepID=A0A1V3X7W4_MYCKA|nr:TetR/AcrR family transcriptional regulator [Mycobacterium kansasii]ETZ99052.1 bacterial regulatory s, tetR family protein [Mycobacterium kansasii 824]AGZ50577.1 TetR family transcriptional regulator [Mycobacterium kansasii ATCC 12478]ARG57665.1 TetR family transcriptional regulator [Mycobacterium kansasii]ARG63138.1 TetR family transcriptional regulator [Mycobacterium kansasii]ARG70724.1 TetR family transcriptional regulator [Mycobacterium kansasii]
MSTAADGGAFDDSGSVRRRRVDQRRRARLLADLEDLLLAEGFKNLTVDDIAQRLRCSKATLYSLAGSKEQLSVVITRQFFRNATAEIEEAVATVTDPRVRISVYLAAIGSAMNRCSPSFYADMKSYRPTADIYRVNSAAAAHRVQQFIADGIRAGALRDVNGLFVGQLIALAIDGVQSGALLDPTGLTAGQAYQEIADLLLHGLNASPASAR